MAKHQMNGDGFHEGTHGRGPHPFKRSMSSKPNGYAASHFHGASGRGKAAGSGMHDGEAVEHPQSHAAFEGLGVNGKDGEDGE